ncbi:class I SAM-dependent methyltransferase [Algoriphagus confluentis]|uniref:Class I SAM-dependent methyltransferase n=1 Tax=Algoriphagus confluentis TaxID=1697556 RepID=A0ABQ6PPS9_9BACT|nr:class I SAM-dependent methyltransferase [Algoriphagus confluentis]
MKTPIDQNQVGCRFCGSKDQKEFVAQERMFRLPGSFLYQECLTCGSIQLKKSPENLGSFYPEQYYSFLDLQASPNWKKVLKKIRLKIFLAAGILSPSYGYWLGKVHRRFDQKIADIGCGNGQLLYELHASGYTNLSGFDPFIPENKRLDEGIHLYKMSFDQAEGLYDLIMMHHSFEHLEDPRQVLSTCFEKLNPGGQLLIRCPVADAEVWKEKREYWVQLDAPRHLIIPSVSGLGILADQTGFTLEEVEFDSDAFQFWGTEAYERNQPLDPQQILPVYTSKELKEMKQKALLFNQEGKGDQACFYLTKPIKS